MHFSDPRWLQVLWALPIFVLLEWRALRRGERALGQVAGKASVLAARRRPGRRRLSALLRIVAFAGLAVGAAGPEWGREVVRRAAYGSDIVLLLDTSASMDARDVPPSRLEEAKREASAVVERMGGSRIALVVFAGDAVRICPLTLDRSAVRLLLESVSTGSVSEPGTDLGRGLRVAASALPNGRNREQVVIAWTDGEDLERGAMSATDDLAHRGTRVFAVGVGTRQGDVVPVLDEQGRAVDIKRDEQGGPVMSRLDEGLLRTLGRKTGGAYFTASRPGGELPRLLGALGLVERGERGERLVERPIPRFPLFAALAGLLLLWDWLWPQRRKVALAVAAVMLLPAAAGAQSAWELGNRAWRRGDIAGADSLYRARLKRGRAGGAEVNLGAAEARLGHDAQADSIWRRAAARPGRDGVAALYNRGSWLGDKGQLDEGLASLREALRRAPGDRDARYNYEVLLGRRKRNKRPQSSPQSQQPQAGGSPRSQGASQGQSPQNAQAPPPQGQTGSTPLSRTGPSGMTREQADWLQTITEQAEREQRRAARQVHVTRERKGKDW